MASFGRAVVNDPERQSNGQTSQESAAESISPGDPAQVQRHGASIVKPLPSGQCFFICYEYRRNAYRAVKVPCCRPERTGNMPGAAAIGQDNGRGTKLNDLDPPREPDSEIYERIKERWISIWPWWKRFLPRCGIKKVEEINIRFRGHEDRNGHFPVSVEKIDVGEFKKACERTILERPTYVNMMIGDMCGGGCHSNKCRIMMEHDQECILDQIEDAEILMGKLNSLHFLTEDLFHPRDSDHKDTLLDGMAQGSCIYQQNDTGIPRKGETYENNQKFHALLITPYKPFESLTSKLMLVGALIFLICWIVAIFGGITGKWSVAIGFGNVLVTFATVLIAVVLNV